MIQTRAINATFVDHIGGTNISAMIDAFLYGITIFQTHMYFRCYPRDSMGTKLLVTLLWVLDTIHFILVSYAVYNWSGVGRVNGQPTDLAKYNNGTRSLYASFVSNVFIVFLVQCFFIKRVYALSKLDLDRIQKVKWLLYLLTPPAALFLFARFALGGFISVVLVDISWSGTSVPGHIGAGNPQIPISVYAVFSASTLLSDILIAITLCIALDGNRTGFKRTNRLLNTLMVYAINCCLLTSVVSFVELLLFCLAYNDASIQIDMIIGKLYINSLLATLNGRLTLRGKGAGGDATIHDLASMVLTHIHVNGLETSVRHDEHSWRIDSNFVSDVEAATFSKEVVDALRSTRISQVVLSPPRSMERESVDS